MIKEPTKQELDEKILYFESNKNEAKLILEKASDFTAPEQIEGARYTIKSCDEWLGICYMAKECFEYRERNDEDMTYHTHL